MAVPAIFCALLFNLSGCASPKSPRNPSPVPLWSRAGTTVENMVKGAVVLWSGLVQDVKLVQITATSVTLFEIDNRNLLTTGTLTR